MKCALILIALFATMNAILSQDQAHEGATAFKRNKALPDKSITGESIETGFAKSVNGKELLVGPWQLSLSTGEVVESGVYDSEGKKTDTWRRFDLNGKVTLESTYKADELNGPFTAYGAGGAIMVRAFYVNGKPDGMLIRFDAAGRVTKISRYRAGEVTETIDGP